MKLRTNIYSAAICSILITSLMLSGGCTLMNPYVDVRDTTNCQNVHSFPEARTCNELIQSKYIDAMGAQAHLSTWSGVTLIPLTAYVAGLSIKGASTNKIADFTLGAAGLFGLSSWLSNSERSTIYGAGLSALQCALTASNGFDISSEDQTSLQQQITKFETQIKEVEAAATSLENEAAKLEENVSRQLSKTEQAVADANQLAANGQGLLIQYRRAGIRLHNATRAINNQVNIALGSSIQSIATLPNVIKGMTSVYSELDSNQNALSIGGETDTKMDLENVKDRNFIAADNALKTALEELSKQSKILANTINRLTPEPATEQLASCGVNPDEVSPPLSLSPSTLTFTSGDNQTKTAVVEGGSEQYVADGNSDFFEIIQNSAFGPVFSVKLKQKAGTGDHVILIQDTSGKKAALKVRITSANDTGSGVRSDNNSQQRDDKKEPVITFSCFAVNQDKNPEPLTLSKGEQTLCGDKDKTEQLQTILLDRYSDLDDQGEFTDGNYGNKTRKAIKRFLAEFPHLGSDITELVIGAIVASDYQKINISDNYINALVASVKQKDPSLSGETDAHKVIQAFQNSSNLPAYGFIDENTFTAFCKTPESGAIEDCRNSE